jgi:hypothetical protein
MTWKPIETAPKGGTRIVARTSSGHTEIVRFVDGMWWTDSGSGYKYMCEWLAGWGDVAALMRVIPFHNPIT